MSDTLLTFHRHSIYCVPPLQSFFNDDYKYIIVNPHIKQSNPELYASINKKTYKTNSLRIYRKVPVK